MATLFDAATNVKTGRTCVGGKAQFLLVHIDVDFSFGLLLRSFLRRCTLFKRTHFVDFGDERVTQRRPQSENEVDYTLLERRAARVDVVDPTDLNYQLKSALAHLGVLVQAPGAGELSELLVVSAEDEVVSHVVHVVA